MYNTSHTPGPWVAKENTIQDLDGRTLGFSAASEVGVEESEANARLMAAAPDLLAELAILRRQIEVSEHSSEEFERFDTGTADRLLARLTRRAAIAKATGQPANTSYRVLAKDSQRDTDGSWAVVVVLAHNGEPERDPDGGDTITEAEVARVYAAVEKAGVHVVPGGHGGAGEPFADEPWLDWFPKLVIYRQRGGRDI